VEGKEEIKINDERIMLKVLHEELKITRNGKAKRT